MAYTKSQVQVGGVLAVAAVGGIALAVKVGKMIKGKRAAKAVQASQGVVDTHQNMQAQAVAQSAVPEGVEAQAQQEHQPQAVTG